MYRDKLERPLARLGLGPKNFHALRMLPLLYVAWANGTVSLVERSRILSIARDRLGLDARAMRLVHNWLAWPPPTKLVREAVACLAFAAQAQDQPDFGTDELLQLLWDAEGMTRAVALQTGVPYEPSEKQREALLEMATLLEIDSGVPWHEMLLELGGRAELRRTLSRKERPKPRDGSPRDHDDRVRRWRAAVRQQSSHRPVPAGASQLI